MMKEFDKQATENEQQDFEVALFHKCYIWLYNEISEAGLVSEKRCKRAMDTALEKIKEVWGMDAFRNNMGDDFIIFCEKKFTRQYVNFVMEGNTDERA